MCRVLFFFASDKNDEWFMPFFLFRIFSHACLHTKIDSSLSLRKSLVVLLKTKKTKKKEYYHIIPIIITMTT